MAFGPGWSQGASCGVFLLVLFAVLLQEVMLGLKYDQSEYVAATLKTIHRCVSMAFRDRSSF